MNFATLAERQILKAKSEGQLDNLKGAGKPLPAQGDGDFGQSVGFRMMAEAGVVPREIELKKAVIEQRQVLANCDDSAAHKRAMAKLADLELRLAIEQEARRRYFTDI